MRSIVFTRKKTETTRTRNRAQIAVPLFPALQMELERLRRFKKIRLDKDSNPINNPFLMGLLEEGYTEQAFLHRYRAIINKNLKEVSQELNLSVPLQMKSARDCFASSLYRNGISRDIVSGLLGHSSSEVTKAYLASMDLETAFKAVSQLVV